MAKTTKTKRGATKRLGAKSTTAKPYVDNSSVKLLAKFEKNTKFNYATNIGPQLDPKQVDPLVIPPDFKVKLGFEIECVTPASRNRIITHMQKLTRKRVKVGGDTSDIENTWRVHSDGSIRFDSWDDDYIYKSHYKSNILSRSRDLKGLEISSSAMQWKKAWENFALAVSMLSKEGSYTNESCGMHMSVSIWHRVPGSRSYKNCTANFKYDDLFNYLDKHESLLCRRWGRSANQYCTRLKPSIDYALSKYRARPMEQLRIRESTPMQFNPRELGLMSKYQTFNLSKLFTQVGNPYIECRIPGNTFCHIRALDAYVTMQSFTQMLLDSIEQGINKPCVA